MKFKSCAKGLATLFHFPNNVNLQYRTGRQPYSPGQTQTDSGGPAMGLIPWPTAVPSLLLLASSPGTPRAPGMGINNNSTASTPNNSLFIGGFTGKSKG
jgi:hypothetical protein